ncbi:uncharacterized protein EV420DRAFT_1580452 [Desarmillaria tabescens]|uniref:F-box domain-containing protein n=1 Tax=Armillaria tabescens TaxID=1929756 RepID=A0AA39MNG8_ARMTA|nr:uncharacterized protein EV420DRAFT_1580452 [Desarmillaria tabescens]KAK0441241.1 hypothetical protein EV420DRAFT_1580452 [Desarmillaria tabescens]
MSSLENSLDTIPTSCTFCGIGLLPDPKSTRSARVTELLQQNGPPSYTARPALLATVQAGKATLLNFDEEIKKAREVLENLLLERERVALDVADAETLLHPIRLLSDDLLREIFSWCVYDWDDIVKCRYLPNESLDPRRPPWTLTRISRRWREIAVSFPRLWSTMILDFSEYIRLEIPGMTCLFRLGLYLQRSRDTDLSVSIHSNSQFISDQPSLTLLETSMSRWKHLRLHILPNALKLFSGNTFLRLHTLKMRVNSRATSLERAITVDVFRTAPHLLDFESMHDAEPCRILRLPWSKITTYASQDATSEHSWNALEKLTSAKVLSLCCSESANFPDKPVVMPSILKIAVKESRGSLTGTIARVFQCLHVPSLNHLNLFFTAEHADIHFPNLGASATSLTHLRLSRNLLPDTENIARFIDFLKTTIHVESLCLHMAELPDNLLIALTRTKLNAILPALRILTFSSRLLTFSTEPFLQMFESRYNDARRGPGLMANDGNGRGGDAINPPSQGSSSMRPQHASLKELRIKRRDALSFNSVEDKTRWDRICKGLNVIHKWI